MTSLAKTKQKNKKPAGEEASRGRSSKYSRKKSAMVRKMIGKVEKKLDEKDIKPTLGDFIKLLQLDDELGEEEPREIRVTWIEPSEGESAAET